MSDSSNSGSSGGIGFAGLLAIVFITLKLLHKVAWSWWWVLSPLWIGAAFAVLVLVVIVLLALVTSRGGKRARRYGR
jgi:uncharacterized membrane protein YhaH (DUF805 family)